MLDANAIFPSRLLFAEEQRNLNFIRGLMIAMIEGDYETFGNAFGEYSLLERVTDPILPIAGEFCGARGLARYFEVYHTLMQSCNFTVDGYYVEGDIITVVGVESIKVLATEKTHHNKKWAIFFQMTPDGTIDKSYIFEELYMVIHPYRAKRLQDSEKTESSTG